ncbi:MAG: N-acetylneuraminate synthase family protein [Patescibacteria group bacterium]
MNYTTEAIWNKIQNGVFVIAEAGKNFIHTEKEQSVKVYLKNAMELARLAKEAGADAIKFQTHVAEDEILNIHVDSPHFPNWKSGRRAWITRNEMATPIKEFWKPLKKYCEKINIAFFSTPMSRAAAFKLAKIGMPIWKIGSGDILDFTAMDYMRNTDLPIIMSSGMSTVDEVEKGLRFLRSNNKRVALMHCLSKYPGLPKEANLGTMLFYQEKWPDIPIGFSENSIGYEPSVIAVALGAKMVEKHFTLRRDLWGPDHKVSSTPKELREFVTAVRKVEADPREKEKWLSHPNFKMILGKKEKKLQEDEKVFRPLFRKALMAGQDISAGTILRPEMIYAMRPQQYAGGLPSEKYEEVIGKRIVASLKKYDPITPDILAI